MTELTPYHRKKGKQIQAALRKKSGNSTYRPLDAAREVRKLLSYGGEWTKPLIAAMLDRDVRSVNLWLKALDEFEGKRTMGVTDLADRHQKMLEWDIKAFEAWFLEFSPHDYFPKHARSWVQAFLDQRNLLLNVPPGHAKSEFFMIWLPTWLICRDRNVQILMVSNSADDAATWALEVAGQLQSNQQLVEAYGRFAPENTREDQRWTPASGTFSVQGRTRKVRGAQFTMESRGMTGRILGRRADFILIDDPTKQEDAESETARKTQLSHLRQQVFSRAEPGAHIVVIGQRVHVLDLYGELEKQERVLGFKKGERVWHVEKYPAVLRWPDEDPENPKPLTLWPERWPWEELQEAYEAIGGEGPFFCMYQQQPAPEGTAIFKQSHLLAARDYSRGVGMGFRRKPGDGFLPIVRVLSVDPSPSKFNGILMGDSLYDRDRFTYAATEIHRTPASLPQLKALCDRLIEEYHPDYFIFEESGFLLWLRDDPWFMELKNRVKLILHKTGVNKNSMEYGVQSLAVDFEFGRISLPYGDEESQRMTDMLIQEASLYPFAETSDLLMALWFVKFNYQNLRPRRETGSNYRQGKGTKGGWSFLRQLKSQKNMAEIAYREHQKAKKEMSSSG